MRLRVAVKVCKNGWGGDGDSPRAYKWSTYERAYLLTVRRYDRRKRRGRL